MFFHMTALYGVRKVQDLTKYQIHGGRPLHGTIEISGAKNAAVAIIPAALMVDGVCRIENIPQISDVTLILQILRELGADVKTVNKNTVDVDCSHIRNRQVPYELARKIRASYYLVGALLGRFGWAEVPLPGGCDLGGRPIDQHIKGFVAMGADVDVRNGLICAQVPGGGRLAGGQVYLDMVSVGATMNIMLAATLANGMTVIENAAKEPHIVDLANFLNSMGADIMGAGTDVIKIRGVERLSGGTYSIIPDQIEAGTYMAAVAAAGGEVLIKNVIPKHLDCITAKLVEMGVDVEEQDDAVLVRRDGPSSRVNVKTVPYPRLPHRHAAPDRRGALPGPGDQRAHRGRLGEPLSLCGRVPPHGGPHPGGRQGGRHRGRGAAYRGAGPRLRPAGRRGHGHRRAVCQGCDRGGRHLSHRAGL